MSTSLFLILILALIVLVLILGPFLSKERAQTAETDLGSLEEEKEYIFSELSDLEYDYRMGKIPEADYQKLKTDLSLKAESFMSRSDQQREMIEKEVDQEIAAFLNHRIKKSNEIEGD